MHPIITDNLMCLLYQPGLWEQAKLEAKVTWLTWLYHSTSLYNVKGGKRLVKCQQLESSNFRLQDASNPQFTRSVTCLSLHLDSQTHTAIQQH